MARTIEVKIVADTRAFRRGLLWTQKRIEGSWWRRLALSIALWRLNREEAP